ncbi:MAG TPA: hypothetical protein VMX18_01220 [Candidatus Bipolaricaulota bacterium]|nr:hypothetical protein [Candidatus Bipolaricaulota bacterium]
MKIKYAIKSVITIIFLLFLVSCSNENVDLSKSDKDGQSVLDNSNIIQTSEDAVENVAPSFISTPDDFSAKDYISERSHNLVEKNFDLDGDGIMEKAIQYIVDDVIVRANDKRKIQYVEVYRWEEDGWKQIKKDEATNIGGTADSEFCAFDVVNLGDDSTEELLTSKCQPWNGSAGYAVFAYLGNNEFGDLAIPKGYLHEKEYLWESDTGLDFLRASIDGNGITEKYKVICESRDYFARRFGDQAGGGCRDLEIFIPYDAELKSFGDGEIFKNEFSIYSKPYSQTNNNIQFQIDLPLWMEEYLGAGRFVSISDKWASFQDVSVSEFTKFDLSFDLDFTKFLEYAESIGLESDELSLSSPDSVNGLFDELCEIELKDKIVDKCVVDEHIFKSYAYDAESGKNQVIVFEMIPEKKLVLSMAMQTKRKINYFDEAVILSILNSFKLL